MQMILPIRPAASRLEGEAIVKIERCGWVKPRLFVDESNYK